MRPSIARVLMRICAYLTIGVAGAGAGVGVVFVAAVLEPSLLGGDVAGDEATLERWLVDAERAGELPEAYADVADAVVALEDRRFWARDGAIDVRAVARSMGRDVRALAPVEGASTIEMQVAKLARRRTGSGVDDKLRETVLAVRAARRHDKRAFIVAYVDHLPCGAVVGARACGAYLFGQELDDGDSQRTTKAALIAAQVLAPTRLQAARDALQQRAQRALDDGDDARATFVEVVSTMRKDKLASASLAGSSVLDVGRERARVRELRRLLPLAVRQAQSELALKEPGVVVIAVALAGDEVVDVLGNWRTHELPAGSFAKLWMLDSIIEQGPRAAPFVTDVRLPGRMPAWDLELRAWRPRSVGEIDTPVTLVEAVARSHNATSIGYLYYPFWLAPADADALVAQHVTASERAKLATPRDRAVAITALTAATGFPYDELPDVVDRKLEYRASMLAMMRMYRDAVVRDLPSAQVPAQPSSLLGQWSARPDEWVHGLARVWFADAAADDGACRLSPTGAALAAQMKVAGTLHTLAAESTLPLAAKTATSPSSIAAAIGYCDGDEHVVVVMWAFRPDWQHTPKLQGAQLAPALRMFVRR